MNRLFKLFFNRTLVWGGTAAVLMVPLVVSAQGLVPCDGSRENPCDFGALIELIQRIIDFLLLIAAPIASIMFAYAGWLWLSSTGKPDQISKAKSIFTTAFVGIGIALGAWLIIKLIADALVDESLNPLGLGTLLSTVFL